MISAAWLNAPECNQPGMGYESKTTACAHGRTLQQLASD